MSRLSWHILNDLEKEAWGSDIESNRYLSTIGISLIGVLGAFVSGCDTLNSWFGWEIGIPLHVAISVSIIIFGCLLAESIISARTVKIAAIRSGLALLASALAFGLGYLLAIVALFALMIYFVILILMWAFGVMINDMMHPSTPTSSGGGNRTETVTLEDGTVLTNEGSGWYDDSRNEWKEEWGKFTKN